MNGEYSDSYKQELIPYYRFIDDRDIDEICESDTAKPSWFSVTTSNHFKYIRKIERLRAYPENWDGYNASALYGDVAKKAIEVVESINFDFYSKEKTIEVSLSPYSTVILDWVSPKGELSLEIGITSIGYFIDGTEVKEVPRIDISSADSLLNAISLLEDDLSKLY